MPFWKVFLQLEQLFDAKVLIKRLPSFCVPKITGNLTRVTKIKVVENMADINSLKSARTLNVMQLSSRC